MMKFSRLSLISSGLAGIVAIAAFTPISSAVRGQEPIDCALEQAQMVDSQLFELRDRLQQTANAGNIEEAAELLSQGLRLMQRLPNDGNKASIFAELVNGFQGQPSLVEQTVTQFVATGQPEKAPAVLAYALQVAQGLDAEHSVVKTRSLAAIAGWYAQMGEGDRAADILSQARQSEIGIRGSEFKAKALSEIARAYIAIARFESASEILFESLRQAQLVNYPNSFRKASVFQPIAVYFAKIGEFERALEIARDIADENYQSETYAEIALECAKQGKLKSALQIAEAIALVDRKADALAEIADAGQKAGESDEKIGDILARGLQVAQTIEDSHTQSRAIAKIALQYAKSGYRDRAVTLTESINFADIKAKNLGKIAVFYAKIGERQKALQLAINALESVAAISDSYQQSFLLQEIVPEYLKWQLYPAAIQGAQQIESVERQRILLQEIAINAAENGEYNIAVEAAEILPSNLAALAVEYQNGGETQRAGELLQQGIETANALELPDAKFDLLAAIALAYAQIGQPTKAEELFSQALEFAKNNVGDGSYIWTTVFQRYLQAKEYDLAERIAKSIADKSFQDTALRELVTTYLAAGEEAAAFRAMEAFAQPQPKVRLLLDIADNAIRSGKTNRALDMLDIAFQVARRVPGPESNMLVFKVQMDAEGNILQSTEIEDPEDRGSFYEEIALKYARLGRDNRALEVAAALEETATRDRLRQRLSCYR
ncbi:tetratricopeptide repeat protein [Phormidium sp. CCY1219]|uniref:tetratricopeptide repeat protein n=1 Tax=Phormidium sp. CCY1219 TaxID=2886104 RepID=UPI002D1EA96D|nr:hypothetical protein [Phormidium sp. CCY1219]MEB3830674.1 hypothetical protein [Phormidium sp. CCY1219]